MKGAFKRAVSLVLSVLMLASTLLITACNRKYDEAEVLKVGESLMRRAEVLNFVYYGSGIEYFDKDDSTSRYRSANPEHLKTLGFSTLEELMKMTEEVFSVGYTNTVYSTVLSTLRDDTTVVSYARYYQAYDEQTNEPTEIMVFSNYPYAMKGHIEYDYATLRVEGSKKEKVKLLIDATVFNEAGQSQKTTVTISLVEEENGWRISNPTYANYNEYKDRYDELKDKDLK